MNLENLRALWDAHSRPVYAYLLRLTKNRDEASDHLQELFCRLARQPGDLPHPLQALDHLRAHALGNRLQIIATVSVYRFSTGLHEPDDV